MCVCLSSIINERQTHHSAPCCSHSRGLQSIHSRWLCLCSLYWWHQNQSRWVLIELVCLYSFYAKTFIKLKTIPFCFSESSISIWQRRKLLWGKKASRVFFFFFWWQQQFQLNAEWLSVSFDECKFSLPACRDSAVIRVCPPEKQAGQQFFFFYFFILKSFVAPLPIFVHYTLRFMSTKCNCPPPLLFPFSLSPRQDIKNADLALYELNRVITLEPNWPEVYEQRAEVRLVRRGDKESDAVPQVIY